MENFYATSIAFPKKKLQQAIKPNIFQGGMPRDGAELDPVDWIGVALIGQSGQGKSDLALRLISRLGAVLIADDQTILTASKKQGKILLSPAVSLAGKIEIRGLGILNLPYIQNVALNYIISLVAPEKIERLPILTYQKLLGHDVRIVYLNAFEAAIIEKIHFLIYGHWDEL